MTESYEADAMNHTAVEYSCDIVRAYVGHNAISRDDLQLLIRNTHATVLVLFGATPAEEPVPQEPAVPIKKSVTRDAIICLEDGLAFKSLKRHLRTKYGITPDDYRKKWNLPADYPMVAASYSEKRSQLAKNSGLGRKG